MQRWRNILINFVVDLPSSNGFINIIAVVDCFMKMCHGTILYLRVCLRDHCGPCRQGFKTVVSPLQLSLLLCSKSSILGQQSALLRAVTIVLSFIVNLRI